MDFSQKKLQKQGFYAGQDGRYGGSLIYCRNLYIGERYEETCSIMEDGRSFRKKQISDQLQLEAEGYRKDFENYRCLVLQSASSGCFPTTTSVSPWKVPVTAVSACYMSQQLPEMQQYAMEAFKDNAFHRPGDPYDDVAPVVVFLASDESK